MAVLSTMRSSSSGLSQESDFSEAINELRLLRMRLHGKMRYPISGEPHEFAETINELNNLIEKSVALFELLCETRGQEIQVIMVEMEALLQLQLQLHDHHGKFLSKGKNFKNLMTNRINKGKAPIFQLPGPSNSYNAIEFEEDNDEETIQFEDIFESWAQLLGQPDEQPSYNDAQAEVENDDELNQKFPFREALEVVANFLEKSKQVEPITKLIESIMQGRSNEDNNGNRLPVSTQDLANNLTEKASDWKAFLRFARRNVNKIPLHQRVTLLALLHGILSYQIKKLSNPFDSKYTMPSNTAQSLLSFGEASVKYLPEILDIAMFMLSYFLTFMLVSPLHLGVKIVIMLTVAPAPVSFFSELARKSFGIYVASGTFKVPIMWFASVGAIGFSLLSGFLILLVHYHGWRRKKGEQN